MNGMGVLRSVRLIRRAWRAAQVVLIVLVLIGAAWPAHVPAQAGDLPAAAPDPDQTPLAELLDEEGRLDLASSFRGSIDARGWRLVSGPQGAPAFAPLVAEGSGHWSDIFPPRGMTGDVLALAMDGAGSLYAGGDFTIAGGVAANRIAKWNGSAWSALGSGMNGRVNALAMHGEILYAGGEFTSAGGVAANHIAKWNGSAWSALGSGMNDTVTALAVDDAGSLYAGGWFTDAGSVTADHIAKWNGGAWFALGNGVGGYVYALAFDSDGNLYAAGSTIAKWDGGSWSILGSGTNGSVHALAVDGAGNLYAGGYFTTVDSLAASGIAKWDGSAWFTLGSGPGGEGSWVNALVMDGAGNLYAGGYFTNPGGESHRIGKWDGSAWSTLGSGPRGDVYALAVEGAGILYAGGHFATAGDVAANNIAKWDGGSWSGFGTGQGMNDTVDDLAVDGAGNLYAAGNFRTAGGAAANYVARWNGNAWSALGSGMERDPDGDPNVHALAVDGAGNLYAGGEFAIAGGVEANNIARWDGSAWSALGSGTSGDIFAVVADGTGNLYAGGGFAFAGGYVKNIAKWDGGTWHALGSGMGGDWPVVDALAVDGAGNLYAGGGFTSASGVAANHIAKWNGTAWSALGSGMNEYVWALAVDDAGNLYAGGTFTSAGGVAANHIAKWNGSTWSALGSGMGGDYPSVDALAVDGAGNLYAGGNFTTAGGVAANHIAKWDGSSWSALGGGIGGFEHPRVSALAVDSAGNLYAGGYFATAGGKPSAYVARWEPDYELKLTKTGIGSGTVTSNPPGIDCGAACAADFSAGMVVTLTATAGELSTFAGWSGACAGTGSCAVTMNANKAVTATFSLRTFPLAAGKTGIGSGTVTSNPPGIDCGATCSADFSAGTVVTLTATAGALSTFAGWSGACANAGPCIVTMDATKAVTATFTAPGAVTPQASTMYYGQQLQVGGMVAATAPVTVTKVVVFTGTVPAGIFLVGVEGSEPYAGEIAAGRLMNRLLAEGCGTHGACTVVNVAVYAPDGTHTDFPVTSPVMTDRLYLPHVSRK